MRCSLLSPGSSSHGHYPIRVTGNGVTATATDQCSAATSGLKGVLIPQAKACKSIKKIANNFIVKVHLTKKFKLESIGIIIIIINAN